MFIHDETDLGRLLNTPEGTPPWPTASHCHVEPTGPTCRLLGLWRPPVSLCFNVSSPPPLRINLTLLLKVSSIQGLRFDDAMDSWAHRTPGSPINSPPYHPRGHPPSSSLSVSSPHSRACSFCCFFLFLSSFAFLSCSPLA